MFMKCIICICMVIVIDDSKGTECVEEDLNGYLYTCDSIVGDEVTIPCGPYSSNGTTRFIYSNITHDEATENKVLLNNTRYFLQLNVTPFDNGIDISCQPITSQYSAAAIPFIYGISVDYPPTDLGITEITTPALHYPFSIVCPLLGNPEPDCQWSVYDCMTSLVIPPNHDDYYSTDTCTLTITYFRLRFLEYCYSCNATNYLGTAEASVLIQANTTNICQAKRSISISPQPSAAGSPSIMIDEGKDITLKCTVVGNPRCRYMYWEFTSSSNRSVSEKFPIFCNSSTNYDSHSCTQIGELVISNASVNDSGNYTCVNEPDNLNLQVGIQVNAIVSPTERISGQKSIVSVVVGSVLGSVTVLMFVIIMITTILLFMWWRYRKRSRSLGNFYYHLHYNNEVDYDAFLSFAEEDRDAAQLMIKEPLEDCGYSICWHHDAFLPGYPIEDNMERSIYTSRYTIALISQPFLNSEFCMTEINITKRKMQELSRNLLVPVIVDSNCDIPTDLQKITYVHLNDSCLIERLKSKLGEPMYTIMDQEEVTTANL